MFAGKEASVQSSKMWYIFLVHEIWNQERKGDILELLDSTFSKRVRPARVEQVIGTRILVRVAVDLLDSEKPIEDGDTQVTEGFWMDQDSPLLFHVGWASKNRYGLFASEEYERHAKEVAKALEKVRFFDFSAKPNINAGVFLNGQCAYLGKIGVLHRHCCKSR
ncbi:unnamed protein product [Gongylonema pulchrum]|uniref:GCV_T domain-containing protein n=1 Tax=Gongylonema pulchrum TaxID=637853 RepID=A0A183EL47_9BILA|nr:unnamed protein product [Gongylonema pulchrum]